MLRRVTSTGLTQAQIRELRALFAAAWPDPDEAFTDDDWEHGLGGVHVLLEQSGRILSHASVVPRTLDAGGITLHTGYVEAVATWPQLERRGYGSRVMREIDKIITAIYELGALGTGSFTFYERLGWEHWRGPLSVRTTDGRTVRTPDDDGYLMVLRTPATPSALDPATPLRCEWRAGDVW